MKQTTYHASPSQAEDVKLIRDVEISPKRDEMGYEHNT
jgi:hypothetical protein